MMKCSLESTSRSSPPLNVSSWPTVKSSSIRSLVQVKQLSDKDRKQIVVSSMGPLWDLKLTFHYIATGDVHADWMVQHPGKPWAVLGKLAGRDAAGRKF